MTTKFDAVLTDASRLPVSERIQLIEAIWNTVPPGSLPPLTEDWLAEIRRRSADFDAGLSETISWERIKADALRRAGAKGAH